MIAFPRPHGLHRIARQHLNWRHYPILQPLAVILTLGEMLFLCLFILSIFYFALRHNRGRWIPDWAVPLVVKSEEDGEKTAVERQLSEVAHYGILPDR